MKKFLSVTIIALIALIGLSVSVNATDSLQDQIDSAATGATITLDKDYTEDITITNGKNITINLNGKKITSATLDTITVELGAQLVITGEGEIINDKAGAVIFNNGTTTIISGTIRKTNKICYNIINHGIMTINAGSVINETPYVNGEAHGSLVENGYYNYSANFDHRKGYVAGKNHSEPSLTVNGGTFNGGLNTIKNDDGAKLTINNGIFKNNIQVAVFNVSVATINGGSFEVPLGKDKTTVYNRRYNDSFNKGELKVYGGTFNAEYFLESMGNPGSVEVIDGTFNVSEGIVNLINIEGGSRPDANLTISGGEFATEIPERYLDDNMKSVLEDGVYLVGEEHTVTVADAENGKVTVDKTKAVKGQTIKLTITPDDGYEVDNISLDFGGDKKGIQSNEFTMIDSDVKVVVTFKAIEKEVKDEEKPQVKPETQEPEADKEDKKDETPKTGSLDIVFLLSALVAVISVAGIVTAKKYAR